MSRVQADGAQVAARVPDLQALNPVRLRVEISEDVPPGEYAILAIQNGWDEEWADPSVLQGWTVGGEAVRVTPNGRAGVRVNAQ